MSRYVREVFNTNSTGPPPGFEHGYQMFQQMIQTGQLPGGGYGTQTTVNNGISTTSYYEPPPAPEKLSTIRKIVLDLKKEQAQLLVNDPNNRLKTVTARLIYLEQTIDSLERKNKGTEKQGKQQNVRVRLTGLSKINALNGKLGTRTTWNEEKKRFKVILDDKDIKKKGYVNVQPKNLEIISPDVNDATNKKNDEVVQKTQNELIHDAVASNDVETLKQFLTLKNTDVNILVKSPHSNGLISLLFVACEKNHFDMVKQLLQTTGIDINRADTVTNISPFYIACHRGHLKVVQLLLKCEGLDVFKQDVSGSTAFWDACCKGRNLIVERLLQIDAVQMSIDQPRFDGMTAFHVACIHKNIETIKVLLHQNKIKKCIDINRLCVIDPEVRGHSASMLYYAATHGNDQVVKLLLNSEGIDVNLPETLAGCTPLITACLGPSSPKKPTLGHINVVKQLLAAPTININLTNLKGSSPFYLCCQNGHFELVMLMIHDQRTDIHQQTLNNISPLQVAKHFNHDLIAEVLCKKMTERQGVPDIKHDF